MAEKLAICLNAGDRNTRLPEDAFALPALDRRGLRVESYMVNTRNLLSGLIFVARLALRRRPQVVIAGEYYCTFFACLWFGMRSGVVLVSVAMNQSRRLLHFGLRPLDGLIDRIFRRLRLVVVHSVAEAGQFSALHGIPADRFAFAHWGYDLPAAGVPAEPVALCMVGRNNRDWAAFLRLATGLGLSGLIVAPVYAGLPADPAPGVTARFDIPMADCISAMAAAEVNVVALLDASRGAGHITLVSAMHLGRPLVVSAAPQIADYVLDGVNGLVVPLGDDAALADAVQRLRRDPALAERLGEAGRRLAGRFMSHGAARQRLDLLVEAALSGAPVPFLDPDWAAERARLDAG